MNEYIINILFILIFIFILKYIKDNNLTLSDLANREPKTDKELEELEEFKRLKKISDEKEKNKIRY